MFIKVYYLLLLFALATFLFCGLRSNHIRMITRKEGSAASNDVAPSSHGNVGVQPQPTIGGTTFLVFE